MRKKYGRRLAVEMLGAAAGLTVYCGSFWVKEWREGQQITWNYEEPQRNAPAGEETEIETKTETDVEAAAKSHAVEI